MPLIRSLLLTRMTVIMFCWVAASCAAGSTDGGGSVERLLKSDLEKIKQSAISYLKTKKPLNWEIHLAEIERGAILELEQEQRIGRWMVTTEVDSVTLVRDADIAPEVRRFGMVFVKRDGTYTVASEFWERESFQ